MFITISLFSIGASQKIRVEPCKKSVVKQQSSILLCTNGRLTTESEVCACVCVCVCVLVLVTDASSVHVFATAVKHVVRHRGIVITELSANSWTFCMPYVTFHSSSDCRLSEISYI